MAGIVLAVPVTLRNGSFSLWSKACPPVPRTVRKCCPQAKVLVNKGFVWNHAQPCATHQYALRQVTSSIVPSMTPKRVDFAAP
ncbi:MAG: hypothetical protein JWN23_3421 [Rhodocyclales bacterium]|nr:hypothetical protein [Rhodocyclales bacterium]